MKKNTKKISKIIAPVALTAGCLATLPATSCGMHSSVKHIAPYLHEITYDDYTYDKDFVTTESAEAFGCSSVRNGNFYGRNFDYVFNDTPEFVVRVKANKKKNRHASIGIATHFGLRESKLLKGEYKKQLELVPNITLDGINDAGVICSHNVVSMEPGEIGEGTNPGAEKLHMLFIPRFVLDNASSAQDAVDKLATRNIVGNLSGSHYLHIMIADAKETHVVEFFDTDHDGKFNVVDQIKDKGHEIMTNYYVNNNGDFDNYKKLGDERYEILKANYSMGSSFSGMETLMKKVMYSNAYRFNHDTDKMRGNDGQKTELNLSSEWYSESIDYDHLYDPTFDPSDPTVVDKYNRLKQDYWNSRLLDYRNPPEPKFWQTTHNSTYDMENKHLRVVVQEQYEVYYDYYL
ncbi:MAG: hypothetical protein KBS35_02945 [Mycoplasma sp.]|nr:hypothetical protein [Candidatus Hennigella equi]